MHIRRDISEAESPKLIRRHDPNGKKAHSSGTICWSGILLESFLYFRSRFTNGPPKMPPFAECDGSIGKQRKP